MSANGKWKAWIRTGLMIAATLAAGNAAQAGAGDRDRSRIEREWRHAVRLVSGQEVSDRLEMPAVVFARPPQSLAPWGGDVRGAYSPLANTVTVVDLDALHHELVHAALYQIEGLAATGDEARVRRLSGDAPRAAGLRSGDSPLAGSLFRRRLGGI